MLAACAGGEPGACEGFSDRELGIEAQEYRPCATEILSALDSLRPRLQEIVAGDKSAADEARSRYRDLRALIDATGVARDFRSMESSTVIVKWPQASMRSFNSAAFTAAVQYSAVLAYPNDDNLRQGVEAHEEARRAYGQIR